MTSPDEQLFRQALNLRGTEGFPFRELDAVSLEDFRWPTDVHKALAAEEQDEAQAQAQAKRDLWVYGLNLALTVGEVGKTSAEWATYDGGSLNTFLDQVGELMAVGAASLGLWQTAKGTAGYVAWWAMVMGSAVSVVTVFESMAGFGAPDQGSGFSAGERKLKALERTLDGLDPDAGQWSGDAANMYSTRNGVLKGLADQMAVLDQQMADLVKVQAGQADTIRRGLAGTKLALEAGILVTAGIVAAAAADPTGAMARALGWVMMGVGGAAFVSAAGLGITGLVQGAENASTAKGIAEKYGEVVSKAAPASSSAPDPVSPVAPAPAPASAAAPVKSAAAPAFAPALAPSAATGAPVSAAPTSAADPTPTPAAAAMPTLGQIAQTVGIATQLEAGLAQASTQGMQSVQQFASMAVQAGRRAPAGPVLAGAAQGTDKDAADHEVPPGGAISGETGTGRAPVDAGGPAPATDQQERLA